MARRTRLLRMCAKHEQRDGQPDPDCPACRGEVGDGD